MSKNGDDSFLIWMGRFCGQRPNPSKYIEQSDGLLNFPPLGMGRSQLNEFFLLLQLDRVSEGFYEYVFGGEIKDFNTFKKAVNKFRVKSMIKFGHVKFAFKKMSNYSYDETKEVFQDLEPVDESKFKDRHKPLVDLKVIPSEKTHYLGYLTQAEIREKLENTGGDKKKEREGIKLNNEMEKLIRLGEFNHECYLDYDHIDVYVATSMRRKIDFWNIANFTKEVFGSDYLKDLNLRYFDPTQAYCKNRVDKGLVEALMLKRAKCTIYMAGESESLGKDSELAATLAQGKPVIAFVPTLEGYKRFREDIVENVLKNLYADRTPTEVALEFLQLYYPEGAWSDKKVRVWLSSTPNLEDVVKLIFEKAKDCYDKKANTLLEVHPLGIQVNLATGVANGVLVARKTEQCAKLVRSILLNKLEFSIKDLSGGEGAAELREKETNSLYRVVTEDQHLVNSFWNFYLQEK